MLRSLVRRRRRASGEEFESRIVWILGSPRSGSTWLLQLLGEHPLVIPINEPLIGWFLGPLMVDVPGIDPADLDVDNFTLRRLQRSKHSQFFSDEYKDVWLPGLRRLIQERLRAEAGRANGAGFNSLVAVKEPNGSQSADVILDATPRSRLLWLLRDGRDVVDSDVAASQKGSWLAEEAGGRYAGISDDGRVDFLRNSAHRWLWRTQVVQAAYEQHDGPKLLVRYEDLLADPGAYLRTIFDWLGLDIGDADLKALVDEHDFVRLPKEDTGPLKFHRAASPGLWRENLNPEEQSVVDKVLGAKVRELGYD